MSTLCDGGLLVTVLLCRGDQVAVYMVQARRITLAACKHVDGVLACGWQTDIKPSPTTFDRLRHTVGQAGAVSAITVHLTDQFHLVRVRLERHLDEPVAGRQQTVGVADCTYSELVG